MLDVDWGKVKTICFSKAGISEKKCIDTLLNADNPQLEKLAVHTSKFFPEGTMEKDVVSMDNLLKTTELIIKRFLIEPTCSQSGVVCQALVVL